MSKFILKNRLTGMYYVNKGYRERWVDDKYNAQLFTSKSRAMHSYATTFFWDKKEEELRNTTNISYKDSKKQARILYMGEFVDWFNQNYEIIEVQFVFNSVN